MNIGELFNFCVRDVMDDESTGYMGLRRSSIRCVMNSFVLCSLMFIKLFMILFSPL